MRLFIDNFRQDLRYGLRSLRRNPGFSAVVVFTLALGIGANSGIFSLVYAAVLRPLRFAEAERLAFVSTGRSQTGLFNGGVSGRELEDWKPQLANIFDAFATVSGNRDTTWTVAGQGLHLANREVTANFFPLLGVRPFAGRAFTVEETQQGRGDVAVVSYEFWQRRLGGDLRALGQRLRKKGSPFAAYTLVGILPADFEFDDTTDVWTPQQPQSGFLLNTRTVRPFRVIGRLRAGISLTQAQAAMKTLAVQEAAAFPASNRGWSIATVSMREHMQGGSHRALWLLWAAVGALLLIACANTANLLLARSGARESEVLVRLALGASRGRLVAQLLTESAVLALSGGALGWVAAAWSLRGLRVWGASVLPASTQQELLRLHAGALDPAVLGFTMLACMLAVLAFGMAPAWRAAAVGYGSELSAGTRATRRQGLARLLVTSEAALVMVLVMSAGLLIRSFVKLTAVDPGFRAVNRLTFDVELPPAPELVGRAPSAAEVHQRWQRQSQWFGELASRLRSIPGIEAVGAADAFPFKDEEGGWGVTIDGKQMPPSTSMAMVMPGYFEAMGIPILRGADFNAAGESVTASKALMINQAMARLLFPDGDPVGKHIQAPRCGLVTGANDKSPDCVITGVVGDTRFTLDSSAPPILYYSLFQDVPSRITYVVRVRGDAAEMLPPVRVVMGNMPAADFGKAYVFHLQSVEELAAKSVAAPRFRSWLTAVFAGLALLLAAVGIYGVQAYSVSRRTREIGIRMAMGARPGAVMRMILSEAAAWTLLGIGVGLVGGLAGGRFLSGWLFGVSAWDGVTLAVSPAVLLVVALAAAYVPARRAMRVDPLVALRWD